MPYLFVGGAQRSGTSLLQSMLCTDERANPHLPEIEYLRYLLHAYRIGSAGFEFSLQHYFEERAAFTAYHAGWVRDFLRRTLDRYAPADHLVLKEPHMTRYFPELWELVEEARFVVIARDPRDTIASLMEVGRRLAAQGEKHFLVTAKLGKLVDFYKGFYAPSLKSKDKAFKRAMLVVRYEDLVRHTGKVVERLRDFTGLALRDIDPADPWRRSVRPVDRPHERQRPWRTELYGKGVDASHVGRYREVLSKAQVAQVDRQCADIYKVFGYRPAA